MPLAVDGKKRPTLALAAPSSRGLGSTRAATSGPNSVRRMSYQAARAEQRGNEAREGAAAGGEREREERRRLIAFFCLVKHPALPLMDPALPPPGVGSWRRSPTHLPASAYAANIEGLPIAQALRSRAEREGVGALAGKTEKREKGKKKK